MRRHFRKIQALLLSVLIGVAAVFIFLGFQGTASPVSAQEYELPAAAALVQPEQADFVIGVVFTDPAVLVFDLSGTFLGEGEHDGRVRCLNKCSQKTVLSLNSNVYGYKFESRQALDLDAERVVVAGTGTMISDRQKERFSFTALFQNNRDGTIFVRYESSIPGASFVIPNAPGIFTIQRR